MIILVVMIAVLYAAGTYLVLQRTLTRVVLGLALLGHGANVLLLVAGGRAGRPPFVGSEGVDNPAAIADPLPQAMALTAIVITFGLMAFLLALAYRSWTVTRNDEVEDDIEDRRIAELAAREHLRDRGDEVEEHPVTAVGASGSTAREAQER
jgi:multicomponent Na+:H+ antiporter subunit C